MMQDLGSLLDFFLVDKRNAQVPHTKILHHRRTYGVNKNLNNSTNKPILEIEKPNWRAESILLAMLNIQEFIVLEKGETSFYF